MVNEIQKDDREFLRLMPLLVHWIKNKRQLSDNELLAFMKHYPKHYDFSANTSVKSMFDMAYKYRNHKIYGKDIEIIMTLEGQKWVTDFFLRLRQLMSKK
jgi:hypothetical protein